MIKLKTILVATGLVVALAFTGCSPKVTAPEKKPVEQVKTMSISEGTQNMRGTLKVMKEKLRLKDEAGAISISSKLEENWAKIKDNLKIKDKGLYEKVEGPLTSINGGVKVKPLDVETLTKAINSLDEQLMEILKMK